MKVDTDGITSPRRLRDGYYDEQPGTFWAWPVDGYYDLHHAPRGVDPDGSDVIEECLPTLAAARERARFWHSGDMRTLLAQMRIGGR